MLHHVCEEMEDLRKSRDFWEDQALHANEKVATLKVLVYLLQILLLKIVYLKIFLFAYLLVVKIILPFGYSLSTYHGCILNCLTS